MLSYQLHSFKHICVEIFDLTLNALCMLHAPNNVAYSSEKQITIIKPHTSSEIVGKYFFLLNCVLFIITTVYE